MTDEQPVISIGTGAVAAPVVRTGSQLVTAGFLVQGVELFVHDFPEAQQTWLTGAVALGLCFLQNFVEARRGRKLVGPKG